MHFSFISPTSIVVLTVFLLVPFQPPPTSGPYYTTNTYLCLGMDVISIWPDFYTQDTLCPKIYRSTDLGRSVPVVVLFVDIVREVEGGNNPA